MLTIEKILQIYGQGVALIIDGDKKTIIPVLDKREKAVANQTNDF